MTVQGSSDNGRATVVREPVLSEQSESKGRAKSPRRRTGYGDASACLS